MTKLDIIVISNAIAYATERQTGLWNLHASYEKAIKEAAFKVLTEVQEKENAKTS